MAIKVNSSNEEALYVKLLPNCLQVFKNETSRQLVETDSWVKVKTIPLPMNINLRVTNVHIVGDETLLDAIVKIGYVQLKEWIAAYKVSYAAYKANTDVNKLSPVSDVHVFLVENDWIDC